ncbi:MAG: hypothetical protein A2882_07220 [Phenylobacterium sp. RIFCSPHIGHO2_01_FULL_70_10]|nr:MAG: hypothetical protein A2882_07220 [Phenylobacterium sp. RIFCSPHIGHO2_01_FULL_70_10]
MEAASAAWRSTSGWEPPPSAAGAARGASAETGAGAPAFAGLADFPDFPDLPLPPFGAARPNSTEPPSRSSSTTRQPGAVHAA